MRVRQFAVYLAALLLKAGRVGLRLLHFLLQCGVFNAQIIAAALCLIELSPHLSFALLRRLMSCRRRLVGSFGGSDRGGTATFFLLDVAFRQRLAAMTAYLRAVDLGQFFQMFASLLKDRFSSRHLFRGQTQRLRSRVQARLDPFQLFFDLFAALLDRYARLKSGLPALAGLTHFIAARRQPG